MNLEKTIQERLYKMENNPPPDHDLWPEKCGGSSEALLIFVGPSPGGKKEEERRDREIAIVEPKWNEPYIEPTNWSRGFKVSFKPIVETFLGKEYPTAAKLIAVLNMDWMQNPESSDVSFRYMWEGCNQILPIIERCNPSSLIPMDMKTFGVIQIGLFNSGFEIQPIKTGSIKIRISDRNKKPRYHRDVKGFIATKKNNRIIVIKSFQHPARIYDKEYADRVAVGIKDSYHLINSGETINLDIDYAS